MPSCWRIALGHSYGSEHQHSYSPPPHSPPPPPLRKAPLRHTQISACSSLAYRIAPLGDFPSTSPQGTLRCLINNTVEFGAPDLLVLRSRTLNLYLTLKTKVPVLRHLGNSLRFHHYLLWPPKLPLCFLEETRVLRQQGLYSVVDRKLQRVAVTLN